MRSAQPIPGNPWPHEMAITVEDRPRQLLELLWLREAHGLHPTGDDPPPLLLESPERASIGVDDVARAAWNRAWMRAWREAVAHAGREQDPQLFERLRATRDGSAERAVLLREIVGPDWGDEFSRDILQDPSYLDWDRRRMDAFIESRPRVLEDSPERRDLDALIPAWRGGLTRIVTIPCRGEYNRRLGLHALLVTDGTRADSDSYRRALTSFT